MSWLYRTHKCVKLSTTEAEYVAVAETLKEALHVRVIPVFLIPGLGPMSIGVYEDNQGAIFFAKTLDFIQQQAVDMCGTIFSGRWLPADKCQCNMFSQIVTMLMF